LESLPDDILLRVATYLSHTTRALLSVALTAPSTSYDLGGHNENEKDMLAKKMEVLLRENGWKSVASNSLSDVLSYAIENCKIAKIINNNIRSYPKQVRLYYPNHFIIMIGILILRVIWVIYIDLCVGFKMKKTGRHLIFLILTKLYG